MGSRQHFMRWPNPEGGPRVIKEKVQHLTIESAEEAARVAEEKDPGGGKRNIYRCGHCGALHIGRQGMGRQLREEGRWAFNLREELGARVVGCMKVENLGIPSVRLNHISRRFSAAKRRIGLSAFG